MEQDFRVWEPMAARAAPGSRLVRAWALKGGISAEMTGLEVESPDGSRRKLVARARAESRAQADLRAQDEFQLLEWAAGQGLPVPRPVYLDTSAGILPQPYFVMEWVEGEPDFALPAFGEAAKSLAEQAADALARIHQTLVPEGGLAFLPVQSRECAELAKGKGQGWALPAGPALAALRVANHPKVNPAAKNDRASLIHGDFWPGNLLWHNGRLVGVVDWEDAALGDPLADFAIARLDFLWIYGREVFEVFSRRYQSQMALDFRALPYWDLCAALRLARLVGEDLEGWAAFFAPYRRADITPASIRGWYGWFVGRAVSAFD